MSDPFAKTRNDAILAGQSTALLEELDGYADAHTLEETREWLEQDRGIKISAGALSTHLRKRRLIALRVRMQEGAATAEEFAQDAAKLNGGKADDMLFAALRTKIQDLMAESNASPKDIRNLLSLIIQARKTEQDDRRIALLEKKAALLDQLTTQTKSGTAITAETLAEMQRQAGLL